MPLAGVLSGLANLIWSAFAQAIWAAVKSAMSWVNTSIIQALVSTTMPNLGLAAFGHTWAAQVAIMGVLGVPLLIAGIAHGMFHRDNHELFVRIPAGLGLAGAGFVIGPSLMSAIIAMVDWASWELMRLGAGGANGLLGPYEAMFGAASLSSLRTGGVSLMVLVFLAIIALLLAFGVWAEMALRMVAIYAIAISMPLALMASVWGWGSKWLRRLAEVFIALVLVQFVVTTILVLGSAILSASIAGHQSAGQRVGDVVTGVVCLGLAAVGMPVVLRLMPHVTDAVAASGAGAAIASRLGAGGGSKSRLLSPDAIGSGSGQGGAGGGGSGGGAGKLAGKVAASSSPWMRPVAAMAPMARAAKEGLTPRAGVAGFAAHVAKAAPSIAWPHLSRDKSSDIKSNDKGGSSQ